jgi:hypothetical protein
MRHVRLVMFCRKSSCLNSARNLIRNDEVVSHHTRATCSANTLSIFIAAESQFIISQQKHTCVIFKYTTVHTCMHAFNLIDTVGAVKRSWYQTPYNFPAVDNTRFVSDKKSDSLKRPSVVECGRSKAVVWTHRWIDELPPPPPKLKPNVPSPQRVG